MSIVFYRGPDICPFSNSARINMVVMSYRIVVRGTIDTCCILSAHVRAT